MGKADLDFRRAISLRKSFFSFKMSSRNRFSKALPAFSMLNLSRQSEVCPAFFFCQEQGDRRFQFKSNHMKKKFRGDLHSLWWIYLFRQALPLIICNGHRTPEKIFLRWNNEIVVEEKQFIITEPTRIHTKDGRTHNGNLRYTIRPIQDAIDYFHERQGLWH